MLLSANASFTPTDDPLATVQRLRRFEAPTLGIVTSVALHAGLVIAGLAFVLLLDFFAWFNSLQHKVHETFEVNLVEIQKEPEPPKDEPPPPKMEEKPEPKPEPEKAEKPVAKEPAPPAAAQAAQVIAAESKPNEPLDLTNAFVQGTGTVYAGGATMAAGTATSAVRAVAPAATGVVGGTGAPTAQVGSVEDKSRSLRLRGGTDWNCPFPPEADLESLNDGSATVEVSVGLSGRVDSVRIINDSGNGFGRAARSCAMSKMFDPALDRQGLPTASTKQFRVRFSR
jgi:periplasmic protein TonB